MKVGKMKRHHNQPLIEMKISSIVVAYLILYDFFKKNLLELPYLCFFSGGCYNLVLYYISKSSIWVFYLWKVLYLYIVRHNLNFISSFAWSFQIKK